MSTVQRLHVITFVWGSALTKPFLSGEIATDAYKGRILFVLGDANNKLSEKIVSLDLIGKKLVHAHSPLSSCKLDGETNLSSCA